MKVSPPDGAHAVAWAAPVADSVWALLMILGTLVLNWQQTDTSTGLAGFLNRTFYLIGLGLFLGILARRAMRGAIWGAFLGFVAAGSFYVLAPLGGYVVMFAVWMGTWFAAALPTNGAGVLPAGCRFESYGGFRRGVRRRWSERR